MFSPNREISRSRRRTQLLLQCFDDRFRILEEENRERSAAYINQIHELEKDKQSLHEANIDLTHRASQIERKLDEALVEIDSLRKSHAVDQEDDAENTRSSSQNKRARTKTSAGAVHAVIATKSSARLRTKHT